MEAIRNCGSCICSGLQTVGEIVHKPFAAVYWCGCEVDRGIVDLTNRYLPVPVAKVVQVFSRLTPYIAASLILIPPYLAPLTIFAFKAIASKGEHIDWAGLAVGVGLQQFLLGGIVITSYAISFPTITDPAVTTAMKTWLYISTSLFFVLPGSCFTFAGVRSSFNSKPSELLENQKKELNPV